MRLRVKILDSVSTLFSISLFLGHFLRVFDRVRITLIVIIVDLLILLALLTIDDSYFVPIRLLYIVFEVVCMYFRLISTWIDYG
jgi:hypothetical protein